jgi:hypothetical protein
LIDGSVKKGYLKPDGMRLRSRVMRMGFFLGEAD